MGFDENDEPNFSFRHQPCSFYSGTKGLAEEAFLLEGAETVWQVPLDRTIPHTEHFAFDVGHPEKLIDYIWGQHMLQMSSESLHA